MYMRNIFKGLFRMFFPKKMIGVDIGTSSVKLVEISSRGEGKRLENYGEKKLDFVSKEAPLGTEKIGNKIPNKFLSIIIREILEETKIKNKNVIFSIPDFSTFCTSFDIPAMPEKEVAGAVYYNASQYITLPISEVTLDWRIISNPLLNKNSLMKVFIVAIPNQVVQEYQDIAKDSGLELCALEAEVFGITKALIKDNKKTVCMIDIGAQSSTINIIDQGLLKRSYSFSFNSNQLTSALSSALKIGFEQAEEIKNKEGLNSPRPAVAQTLYPLIDSLLVEIKNISAEFFQSEKKQVEEIYLTGGTARLLGLKEYLTKNLKKNVYVPNCFSDFSYPIILKETLKDMSPGFSAAVGVALDGLEI